MAHFLFRTQNESVWDDLHDLLVITVLASVLVCAAAVVAVVVDSWMLQKFGVDNFPVAAVVLLPLGLAVCWIFASAVIFISTQTALFLEIAEQTLVECTALLGLLIAPVSKGLLSGISSGIGAVCSVGVRMNEWVHATVGFAVKTTMSTRIGHLVENYRSTMFEDSLDELNQKYALLRPHNHHSSPTEKMPQQNLRPQNLDRRYRLEKRQLIFQCAYDATIDALTELVRNALTR